MNVVGKTGGMKNSSETERKPYDIYDICHVMKAKV